MTARAIPFLPPRSDLLLWLDAADRGTLSLTGSAVTAWRDKGPSARNSSSVTGTVQYSATGFNGRPSVIFNQSWIVGPLLAAGGGGNYTGSNLHCFTVFNASAAVNNTRIFSLGQAGVNDHDNLNSILLFCKMSGNGTLAIWRNSVSAETVGIPTGTNVLAQSSCSSTEISISIDGGTTATIATTTATPQIQIWSVGQNTNSGIATTGFQGAIAEILLFNRRLNTGEQQSVESYLARKWGLTGNMIAAHPSAIMPTVPRSAVRGFHTAWAPTQIAGCQLWLDGADSSASSMTLTGSTVSAWLDKSGSGNNMTASGAPQLVTGTIAGVNYGSGNGHSNNTLVIPMTTRTIFFVLTHANGAGYGQLCGFGAPIGTNVFGSPTRFRYAVSGGTIDIWANNGGLSRESQSMYTRGTPFMFADVGASEISWFGNGNARGTGAFSGVGTTSDTGISLGRMSTAVGFAREIFDGTVHEIIVYGRSLTVSERQVVESYLASKWRLLSFLPVAHPHFTAPAGRSNIPGLANVPILRNLTPQSFFTVSNAVGGVDFTISRASGRLFYMFYATGKTMTFNTIRQIQNAEIFAIAGAGSGASWYGGGGGAGGLVILSNHTLTVGSYAINVGVGGIGIVDNGQNGGNTTFAGLITAIGGGAGARSGQNGFAGGCGGGGGNQYQTGGSAVSGQGFPGDNGGGGGVSAAPIPGDSLRRGGAGVTYYGIQYGGGGGGYFTSAPGVFRGGKGGNNGTAAQAIGGDGEPGSGSGGGGGCVDVPGDVFMRGGHGGSGICIISWIP